MIEYVCVCLGHIQKLQPFAIYFRCKSQIIKQKFNDCHTLRNTSFLS